MQTDSLTDSSANPQTPSDAPTRTDEEIIQDLQRRVSARRAQTEAADPDGSTSRVNGQVYHSVTCEGCKNVLSVPQVVLGGKVLFADRAFYCTPCREERSRADEAFRQREEEAERERKLTTRYGRVLDLLQEAGVNVWDHGDATLDTFDAAESGPAPLEAVRAFIADVKAAEKYDQVRGLYLFGDTGTGKSHLAAAVARELVLDLNFSPSDVVFDHALRLIGKIQRTYNNEQSADEVLDRRIKARVWILDDLGTENPSADVVRRLTEIFTERAMRPTLVTSNLSPDRLESRHAEFYRISSRLGPRYFRTVEVKGRDRRFIDTTSTDNAA